MTAYDLGYLFGLFLGVGLLGLLALIVVLIVKRPRITFVSGRRRHKSKRSPDSAGRTTKRDSSAAVTLPRKRTDTQDSDD